MLKNLTIKRQLQIVPVVIVLSFVYLYFSISSSLQQVEDKNLKASQANKIIKQMLESRISEKNYVRRKDPKYAQEVQVFIKDNLQIAKQLKESFKEQENKKLVDSVTTNITQYSDLFNQYKQLRERSLASQVSMVKEANDVEKIATTIRGIQKTQRDKLLLSGADIKVIQDEIEEASLANKIVKKLLIMRIAEKNYIARKDLNYKAEVDNSIESIATLSLHVKDILDSPKNKDMMDDVLKALKEYKNAFEEFSTLREKAIQISFEMKKEAREAENALLVLRKDQKDEKVKLINALQIELVVMFLLIGVGVILFMVLVSYIISQNLRNINNAAKNLASGEGDLTKRIHIDGNNEIAEVANNINEFIHKVQDAIAEAKHVSSEAASISNELSATSLEIGSRVEDEAVLVKSISNDANKTTSEAEFVNETVKEMSELSKHSFEALQGTTQKITLLIESVKDSSIKEEELALKMQDLKNSTNDVKSILELIGDIAEQTNLLSLNAAIEAARAGEHGRGFAVVADEVRKLAESTQKSLVEINATINVVTQAVDEASDSMQINAKEIAAAAEQAGDMEESIDDVMQSISKSKKMAEDSSTAVDSLKGRVIGISSKMAELNDVSISNARSVEEIASAAEHQNNIIEKLNTQLNSFKS
ncbi:methyl-accepting chemotaxis protein [Sulfurimonas sp. SAG-AH-194-C21]|nr:methyl-accepting chemotaxis protein [Sulfurimonas sp. SAG-AH-194-C21]MDF1882443.1 methyl-accepting chemotaxis protein [Sulfurimonas sp. SAG-AH-194-C21]